MEAPGQFIGQQPLSYIDRLGSRNHNDINMIVIHCTELPDLEAARHWGEKLVHSESRTGNSGHFYIDRDGKTEEWVPVGRVAHHVRGHNLKSIGIELVNNGRYPDWFHSRQQHMSEPYPEAQIKALSRLVNHLAEQFPELELLAGHEDLDTDLLPSDDNPEILIRRKLDPGPQFPWKTLLSGVPLRRFGAEPAG